MNIFKMIRFLILNSIRSIPMWLYVVACLAFLTWYVNTMRNDDVSIRQFNIPDTASVVF